MVMYCVHTCISAGDDAYKRQMALEKVSYDHVNVLIFLFSAAANEAEMLTSCCSTATQRLLFTRQQRLHCGRKLWQTYQHLTANKTTA